MTPNLPLDINALLFDAANLSNKIEEILIETGGELTPELEDLLAFKDYNESQLKASADIVAMTTERLQATINYYEANIEMLNKILSSIVKASDKLISNISEQMYLHNIDSLTGLQRELKFRFNPPSVEIVDESQIPSEFNEIKITQTISKKKIKQSLDLGQIVPGARMVQKRSLKIGMAKNQLKAKEENHE